MQTPITARALENSLFSCLKGIIIRKKKISLKTGEWEELNNKCRLWSKCHTEIRLLKMYFGFNSAGLSVICADRDQTPDKNKLLKKRLIFPHSFRVYHGREGILVAQFMVERGGRGCSHPSRQEAENSRNREGCLSCSQAHPEWSTCTCQDTTPKGSIDLENRTTSREQGFKTWAGYRGRGGVHLKCKTITTGVIYQMCFQGVSETCRVSAMLWDNHSKPAVSMGISYTHVAFKDRICLNYDVAKNKREHSLRQRWEARGWLSSLKHMQAILARRMEETETRMGKEILQLSGSWPGQCSPPSSPCSKGRQSYVNGYPRYGETLMGKCGPSLFHHSALFHAWNMKWFL